MGNINLFNNLSWFTISNIGHFSLRQVLFYTVLSFSSHNLWPIHCSGFQLLCLSNITANLDDAEAEMTAVKHDDLVLICALIENMAQGEEGRRVGQDRAPPGWVALVSNDQVLLVGGNSLIQNCWLIIFIWGCEVVLKYYSVDRKVQYEKLGMLNTKGKNKGVRLCLYTFKLPQ